MPIAISRKEQQVKPLQKPVSLNIKEYYNKRNKILIIRGVGGLGDIFMHRMMFEDFKRVMPEAEIHFACPKFYHEAIIDHPFIDKILDLKEFKKEDYIISYNTTTACGRGEMKLAPLAGPNRSDIWAAHCGLILTKHEMHISITDEEKRQAEIILQNNRNSDGPIVILCPISAMHNKNLSDQQLTELVYKLKEKGLCVIGLHNAPIKLFVKNQIPIISDVNLRIWMAILNVADYVISVDTAAFHCRGGMKKPVVGIFTFANAHAYGQHYPKAELLQGPCDWGHKGCYEWSKCPAIKEKPLIPCLTNITSEMIMNSVDNMMAKWPLNNSNNVRNNGTTCETNNSQGCA